ncbi:MAG: glycosyltransferase [Phycisphaerales bacterium]|nr:glycosyltransferase [Phycisphaerales bacterium]
MRICLVSTELAPLSGWGVGAYTAQAARALAGAGHDVHVLTEGTPAVLAEMSRPAAERALPGLALHAVERGGEAALPHVPCRATRGPMGIYLTLRRLHAEFGFEYIEAADIYGAGYFIAKGRSTRGEFAGAVIGVRLHSPIFALREVNRQEGLNLNVGMVEHLEVEAIRGADVVLSPSRAMLDFVRGRTGDLGERAAVVPYPFDFDWLDSLGPRPAPPHSDATPEVLFYGRLEYRKGIQVLIDAVQRLLARGVRLRVRVVGVDTPTAPGGRSMREWLGEQVGARRRAAIVFEDNRARGELGPLIAGASVVCVPSLWDNFPNVCLEAMACGRVVVATRRGGIPEIIEDGVSGLLCDPGSGASLASVLDRALGDGSLRTALERGAPERVRALCDPAAIARLTVTEIERRRDGNPARAAPSGTPGPLVSVIIPFYNLSEYLPDAAGSVLRQTHVNTETIIVDDGSTEPGAAGALAEIEREWSGRGGGLRVIRQANRGLSAARNAGVAAARGRWVVPLDADDLLDPRFIESALAAVSRDPGLVLVTSWMSCFEGSPREPTMAFVPVGFDRDLLHVANVASSCTALLDREALLTAGGYDESLPAFEDWDVYCAMAERGGRGAVIPEFLIHNRIRPGSMLRSLTPAERRGLHERVRAKHPGLPLDTPRAQRILRGMLRGDTVKPRSRLAGLLRRGLRGR